MLQQIQKEALSLVVNGVNKSVSLPEHELTILRDISFEIAAGSSCAIVGRSGSGKTTLLGILAGIDTATSGSVMAGGIDLCSLDEDGRADFRSRHLGFVFQSFHLIEHLNALGNVMLPMQLKGLPNSKERAAAFLEKVGLGDRIKHFPKQLSGGEQQRVAIARAFACEPTLLFADEPTGNLDQKTGDDIVQSLFELNAEFGTTLVLVTHDMALASQCDQVVTIESGQVQHG